MISMNIADMEVPCTAIQLICVVPGEMLMGTLSYILFSFPWMKMMMAMRWFPLKMLV